MSATGYGDDEAKHLRAEAARRLILGQHSELRRLLARGVVQALRVLEDSPCVHGPLRETLPQIRELFAQHLADEENWLLPALEANLPPGPQRAAPIREKQARHREEIEALCAWPERGGDLELAARFDALARALLTDLAREERDLPVPHVLRPGGMVTDRVRIGTSR